MALKVGNSKGVLLTPFNAAGVFMPGDENGDLRRLAVRGAGVSMLSQGLALIVQMAAILVLARLLAPADFGVVTMVTTFSLLFVNVGLNGFTEAVVQWENLTDGLASNLFWINVGAGLLLTAGFAASGSLLGHFYHNSRVPEVAAGLSVTIFLTSTSVLHLALLKRALRFPVVSANDLFARGVSVAVSILLGFAGWGYWALVAGAVAQALSVSLGAWTLCRWVPRLPRRVPGTASMVRFAVNVYGFFALNYAKGNIDNLLVGWKFGPGMLGLYKKAFDLFCLPGNQLLSPISVAAVPTLCRLQDNPERHRRYLLQAFSILAFVGMGVGACLTLAGRDLIFVLLGPKWEEAGKIFTFFGPGIGAMFLYAPWGWIPLSIGRPERYSQWGFVELIVTGLLFLVALPWGPTGVAVAWSMSFWILVFPATWYAGRPIHFGLGPVIRIVWRYILAALLAGYACQFIIGQLPSLPLIPGATGGIVRVLTTSSIMGVLYLGVVVLLHRGGEPLYQITRLLPDLSPWAPSPLPAPVSPEPAEK